MSIAVYGLNLETISLDSDKFVTTHVVRMKLFRLKAEGVREARLPYFGGM